MATNEAPNPVPEPNDDTPDETITVEIATPDPDQAWKALALVNEWIRHAEAKTGATLAAAGVSGGLLYNLVKSNPDPPFIIDMLSVVSGVSALLSFLCTATALIPRTGWKARRPFSRRAREKAADEWNNLLFYSHIAQRYQNDEPTYQEILQALTSNKIELTKHIANQIYVNSSVAHRKFKWAGRAIWLLTISLVSLAMVAAIIGGRLCELNAN
ncbi:Pycsar system effector family protein [Mycolicibacterium smegmatis]|uniref:Pycsar system effector family protein n=1 Tax=Mycolicibacterium smegmatis TaxID=1772 RepID=UPI001EFAB52A|nr:Pycsar system effector family protein [Mycolicibacterium smegmatis]ULN33608.1 hypothetical protein KZ781_22715 [Mycolicibacterium smegmatis]